MSPQCGGRPAPCTIQETTQKLQNAFLAQPRKPESAASAVFPRPRGQPCSVAKARIPDARFSRRHLGPTTAPTRQDCQRTALQHRSRAEGALNPQPRLIARRSIPEREWPFWAHAFVALPLLVMFFSHWELLCNLQSPVQMLAPPRNLLYASRGPLTHHTHNMAVSFCGPYTAFDTLYCPLPHS